MTAMAIMEAAAAPAGSCSGLAGGEAGEERQEDAGGDADGGHGRGWGHGLSVLRCRLSVKRFIAYGDAAVPVANAVIDGLSLPLHNSVCFRLCGFRRSRTIGVVVTGG